MIQNIDIIHVVQIIPKVNQQSKSTTLCVIMLIFSMTLIIWLEHKELSQEKHIKLATFIFDFHLVQDVCIEYYQQDQTNKTLSLHDISTKTITMLGN